MPQEDIKARVMQKRDTITNWSSNNPLLLKGEIAIVEISPISVKMKVGDGAKFFSDLPYFGDLSGIFQIHAATPATNPGAPTGGAVYETSVDGIYAYFLDINNNPIVVNPGEFVRIIDEGTYFSKVVVPSPVTTGEDNIYELYYADKPARLNYDYIDGLYSSFPFWGAAFSSATNDWFVNMDYGFELSRLRHLYVHTNSAGTFGWAVVTISPSGAMAILAQGSETGAANSIIEIDLESISLSETDPATRTSMDIIAYIAVRSNSTAVLKTDASVPGYTAWQFGNPGGAITKHVDSAVGYTVDLYEMPQLQQQLLTQRNVTSITLYQASSANDPFYASDKNSTILVDTAAATAAINVVLPRFGVPIGKQYVIKRAVGATHGVNVIAADGSKIDGSAAAVVVGTLGAAARFHFDGTDYWRI